MGIAGRPEHGSATTVPCADMDGAGGEMVDFRIRLPKEERRC